MKAWDVGRDDAHHYRIRAALLKNVDAEAAEAGDAIRHVELGVLFELLLLPVRHHAERHVQHVFCRDAGLLGERHQVAIHAKLRIVANLQVKIAGFAFNG